MNNTIIRRMSSVSLQMVASYVFWGMFLLAVFLVNIPLAKADAMASSVSAQASEEKEERSWFGTLRYNIARTWEDGKMDLYVPLYAWHNRLMYDKGEIGQFNENPWGLGIGKSVFDEDGDQHGLCLMGFVDSNDHFQPLVAYAYIANWEVASDFYLGVGVAAGFSARHEYNYIPIPAALPLISIQYQNVAIQATYIPERYNHGNVLFTWLRWHFD